MKFLSLLVLSSLFVSTLSHAASIDLAPGSSIRIRAGEESVISCSGSGSGSAGSGAECRLENTSLDGYYTVYAGQAKIKSLVQMGEATRIIAQLRKDGICR